MSDKPKYTVTVTFQDRDDGTMSCEMRIEPKIVIGAIRDTDSQAVMCGVIAQGYIKDIMSKAGASIGSKIISRDQDGNMHIHSERQANTENNEEKEE